MSIQTAYCQAGDLESFGLLISLDLKKGFISPAITGNRNHDQKRQKTINLSQNKAFRTFFKQTKSYKLFNADKILVGLLKESAKKKTRHIKFGKIIYKVSLEKNIKATLSQSAEPNDDFWPDQWNVNPNPHPWVGYNSAVCPHVNMVPAWNITQGSDDLVFVDIDSGVELNHPEFANSGIPQGKLFINSEELINGIDDDGNGAVDDIFGASFATNSPDGNVNDEGSYADCGHGTMVASIMSGETNNSVGIASASWKGKILPVKAFGLNYTTTAATILKSLEYTIKRYDAAKRSNPRIKFILNLSISLGRQKISSIENALDAIISRKIPIIAAAGNSKLLGPDYPASSNIAGVISVAATTSDGTLWRNSLDGSNYGSEVDIAAPGKDVFAANSSQCRSGSAQYASGIGTSFAAPLVSGVVGLMLSKNPELAPNQIEEILLHTARRSSLISVRSGNLDAGAAVIEAAGVSISPTPTATSTTSVSTPSPTPRGTNTATPTPTRASSPTPTPTSSGTNISVRELYRTTPGCYTAPTGFIQVFCRDSQDQKCNLVKLRLYDSQGVEKYSETHNATGLYTSFSATPNIPSGDYSVKLFGTTSSGSSLEIQECPIRFEGTSGGGNTPTPTPTAASNSTPTPTPTSTPTFTPTASNNGSGYISTLELRTPGCGSSSPDNLGFIYCTASGASLIPCQYVQLTLTAQNGEVVFNQKVNATGFTTSISYAMAPSSSEPYHVTLTGWDFSGHSETRSSCDIRFGG